MFTGIVETVGSVLEHKELDNSASGGNGNSMVIGNVSSILDDCHLGDSIAVNGVCLTVTEFTKDSFKVGIAPETLRRTNLGAIKAGDFVNCERAVAGHVRFGGHFVQGHVDTIAEIVEKKNDGNSIAFTFKLRDPQYILYIVEKGFITVDGASLTVTAVDDEKATFSVMMIAFTQQKVVTAAKPVGGQVNVEVDLMGKLVEKQLNYQISKQVDGNNVSLQKLVEKIVDQKLTQSRN